MPLLVVIFLVVPIVELWLIVVAAKEFGFLNTLAALVAISVVGAWVMRREGTRVWNRFRTQVEAGKVPSKEIADGVCVLAGGALLMTPGFVTDLVGLLLLLPPTRVVASRLLVRRFTKRGPVRVTYRGGSSRAPRRGDVIDVSGRGPAPGQDPRRGELDDSAPDHAPDAGSDGGE